MSAVFDAAVRMLQLAPGGVPAVAPRIGKNANSLAHELGQDGHAKLGLETAFEAAALLGDTRIVEAWAQAQGGMFVSIGYAGGCDDTMGVMADCISEVGDACQALSEALRDGVVTPNELDRVERETDEAVQALHRLRALARANCGAAQAKFGALTAQRVAK